MVATCQSCAAQMPRWMGRCPECGEWGTVVEEPVGGNGAATVTIVETESLASFDADAAQHVPTGIEEVDRVLGGGIAAGSVVLLAGEPGVGKSTLILQVAAALGRDREVLLVCGEEAPQQVGARAARLGPVASEVRTLASPELGGILGAIESGGAQVVVVDSVQTVFDAGIPSAPGSVSQVRECGARLARAARDRGVTLIFVGHVTKEGAVAGPRVLEHIVDVVLHFEGERSSGIRVLRALKNRFGSTQDVGFFEMRSDGLFAIRDASAYLLADRSKGLSGSVLAACVDGQRPYVCEIQALVMKSQLSVPRRSAIGVDASRLPLLLAVIEQRAEVKLHDQDVYVSAVGGIRAAEPAADLPVAMAILSSFFDVALPDDTVAFGEIGLSGQVRQVVAAERRLAEARSVGCSRVFVPYNYAGPADGVELQRIRHVRVALELIGHRC